LIAGGITVNRIAKWNPNTSTWSALDTGLNDICSRIDIDSNGNVYAGGYFTYAGSTLVNCIGKWNGTSWSAFGSGLSGNGGNETGCYGLVLSGNNLFVCGSFTTAGDIPARDVAEFKGIT
jgi:hypothetical protein